MHPAPQRQRRARHAAEPDPALPRLLRGPGAGRSRVRLARGGLGDPHPRGPAPRGVAGPGSGPRSLRPGGGAELRPAPGRAVRPDLLPGRGAAARRPVPGGGRLFYGAGGHRARANRSALHLARATISGGAPRRAQATAAGLGGKPGGAARGRVGGGVAAPARLA